MSIHRYAAKRDANEKEIIEYLRAHGASVFQLSDVGVADLLVGIQGRTFLFEVKNRKGKLTEAQIKFRENWRGSEIYVARSIDDIRAILEGELYP